MDREQQQAEAAGRIRELAIRYANGMISESETGELFRCMMRNEEWKRIALDEIRWVFRLRELKPSLDPARKAAWREVLERKLRTENGEDAAEGTENPAETGRLVTEWVLDNLLPELVQPVFKLIQRRCYAQ